MSPYPKSWRCNGGAIMGHVRDFDQVEKLTKNERVMIGLVEEER